MIKKLLRRILPKHWRARYFFTVNSVNDRRYWRVFGVPANRRNRLRLDRYDIQDGCFLESYWVDRMDGDGTPESGPCAVLVVHDAEILMFDHFGPGRGHFHAPAPFPSGTRNSLHARIFVPESTVEEQIDRSIFELQHNLHYYLKTYNRRKVRRTLIDDERLGDVCAEMRTSMLASTQHHRL